MTPARQPRKTKRRSPHHTPHRIRRIGVLTGGGDAPGLNAVIRAVVKTAVAEYGWQVYGVRDGFEGLVKNQFERIHVEDVRGLLPKGGTVLGTTNYGNPFAMPTPGGRGEATRNQSPLALQNLRTRKIDALAVIGGEGTMAIADEFGALGVPIVGIPKTIDNDIALTDLTFGFDTAVMTAMAAIDKIHTTAASHHRVMVVEVMGRDVGWIALYAGLASSADVILLPEIPYKIQSIAAKVRERDETGRNFSIIVVAEGARRKGGRQVTYKSTTGHVRLGGIGDKVARELSPLVNHDVRVTTLGHIQRGGSPSPFDRILASRLGFEAVRLMAQDVFGHMVAVRCDDIVPIPLPEIAGKVKTVAPDHHLITMARSLGVCLGD